MEAEVIDHSLICMTAMAACKEWCSGCCCLDMHKTFKNAQMSYLFKTGVVGCEGEAQAGE